MLATTRGVHARSARLPRRASFHSEGPHFTQKREEVIRVRTQKKENKRKREKCRTEKKKWMETTKARCVASLASLASLMSLAIPRDSQGLLGLLGMPRDSSEFDGTPRDS